MKVNLLRHIPECVVNWEPLWVYSCFTFESLNGALKRHFHGTKNMSNQVCACVVCVHVCVHVCVCVYMYVHSCVHVCVLGIIREEVGMATYICLPSKYGI